MRLQRFNLEAPRCQETIFLTLNAVTLLSTWADELINQALDTLQSLEKLAIGIWQNTKPTDAKPSIKRLVMFDGSNHAPKFDAYQAALDSAITKFRKYWAARGVLKVDDLSFVAFNIVTILSATDSATARLPRSMSQ